MRAFTIFALIILISVISLPTTVPIETTHGDYKPADVPDDWTIEHNWLIHIVFVNYDAELIDESMMTTGLPNQRTHDGTNTILTYEFSYQVSFANESYTDQLRQVMLDNSINGTDTGTSIDEAELELHKADPSMPRAVFYPRDGRSIDARTVEDWLNEHPAVTQPDLGYVYYILNFTEFDSTDHSLEHWYDYKPTDPDTGEIQDWFRLEWDNELNQDLMMQYAGFGGRHNLFVLDPSADQWYLRWARIWWSDSPYTNEDEYCTKDLDEKLSELDLSDSGDILELNEYIREYLEDPITHLFAPVSPMGSPGNSPSAYVQKGYVKTLVICMDVADGTSVESLEWVTREELQQYHLETLHPFIEWEVDVEFVDINEHDDWSNLFWNYAYVDSGGKTIVDGYGMFNAVYNQMRPNYVDTTDTNITVFGAIFIKKNMEMHVYGRQYTGLGGSGQTCIWKSWERYYRPDETTPKAGISGVQLHEAMHAIGLGHTWSETHYVGDFSFSPMGYFGRFNGTGKFDQNWVQGTYLDQMYGNVRLDFETYREDVTSSVKPEDSAKAEYQALNHFQAAEDYFNSMQWQECYEALVEANEWTRRLRWSLVDAVPPTIIGWGTESSPLLGPTNVWVMASDSQSGIDIVLVQVTIGSSVETKRCEFNGTHYIAKINQVPVDIYVEIKVWAEDWGMNIAYGMPVVYHPELGPTNTTGMPINMIYITIAIGAVSVAIILACVIRKRRHI